MPITTTCPGCAALFRLPDDMAGDPVRCEKCGQVFEVPKLPADTAEPEPEEVVQATVEEPKPPAPRPKPPADPPVSVAWPLARLLAFLMSVVGIGVFAVVWITTHLGPPLPVSAAASIQQEILDPFLPGPNFLMGAQGRPVQTILGGLDAAGDFTDEREFLRADPRLANNAAYKAYLLELEKGKQYHIEMSLGKTPTSLAVFDPNADPVAKQIAKTNANVTLIATQTGMHRIFVAAPLPPDRARYTLRITTVP